MRIEIDFDNKVIEVKDSATLGELVDKLKELDLKEWKEYRLKLGVEYVGYPWGYIPYWTYPYYPSLYPTVTYPRTALEITY
jgi:hypothetical protein